MTRIALPLVALLLSTLAACAGSELPLDPDMVQTHDGVYTVHFSPHAPPVAAEETGLDLHLQLSEDGSDATGVDVEVVPFMPEHGHGITGEVAVTELEMSGHYEAIWTYSMPGLWEVMVHLDGPDGHDHVEVAYEVE